MANKSTLYMSPDESERVRTTLQTQVERLRGTTGKPREPNDPSALVQSAVSAALLQDFAAGAFGFGGQKKHESMPVYAVGRPYLPSTASLEELEPMKLSDLRMETHHRGRVLTLRRISPVVELTMSSWAVVRGEDAKDAERIMIFLHKTQNGKDLLESMSEFRVKEPYFTLNDQDEPTIRVDHPSDLVILSLKESEEDWRQRDINSDKSNGKRCGVSEWKQRGNTALGKKDFIKAWTCYTEGLKSSQKGEETLTKDLCRNRSHINLLLGRYDEAERDALLSLMRGEDATHKELDAKAYYRAGLASYALGNFKAAQVYFEKQQSLQADGSGAALQLKRVKMRLWEQATGEYNIPKIASSLTKLGGRTDVASFNGPSEIRESPGAGRGLFATRHVKTGDLVLAEKAFCVTWSREPGAVSFMTCDMRHDAAIRVFPTGLHRSAVQKLMSNPSQVETVLDLVGDHGGLGRELVECDGTAVVDTFQVHDIIQRNAFGPGPQSEDEDISNASAGLWVRAAYLNHSCVPNVRVSYLGDLMFMRAIRPIATGEEITHAYDETADYYARTAALERTWGFKCRCALCVAEEGEDPAVRRRRGDLEQEAVALMSANSPSGSSRAVVYKAKRILKAIRETYDERTHKELPRRAGLSLEQWLQTVPPR